MNRSWNLPIGGIYMMAGIVFLAVMYVRWRKDHRQQQRRQRPNEERTTLPALPSLPAVLPSYLFDHSEPSPVADGDAAVPTTYCLSCWVRDVARVGSAWALPAGTPMFCVEHAYTTLARALMARAQEHQQQDSQQTGDKAL